MAIVQCSDCSKLASIGTTLVWSGVLLALQFAPLGAGIVACGVAIHLCGLAFAWKNLHRMAIRARK